MKSNNKPTNTTLINDSKQLSQLLDEPPKHLFSNFGSFTYTQASKRAKEESSVVSGAH